MSALALAAAVAAMPGMPMPGHGDHTPTPSDPTPAAGAQTFTVGMAGRAFHPAALDIVLGDTVAWTNDDGAAHTVTSAEAGFDSGRLGPGGKFSVTPAAQGTISYHCTLHFFMTGRVVVHGLGLDTLRAAAHPGAPVTLTGRAPAGVGDVALEARGADGAWTAVAHAAPDAGGTFRATVVAAKPMRVRARSGELLSREVTVGTPSKVVARAVRRGGRIVVRVTTTPAQPRATIRLDRWKWERFDWRPVSGGRLDAHSRATLVVRSAERQRLRVVVTRGVGGYGPSTSATMHVKALGRR